MIERSSIYTTLLGELMASFDTLIPSVIMTESEVSRHVAGLVEKNRQQNQALDNVSESAPVQRVGIVGAGVMGSIVAASALGYGFSVVITDDNPAALNGVKRAILDALKAERPGFNEKLDRCMDDHLRLTSHLKDVAACDLIVESIVENVTAKRTFYSVLEKLCPAETLIVSNTSTLPITDLAAHLRNPQSFGGLHYFPPTGEHKILEIIPGANTSAIAMARLVEFCQRLDRIPIVVVDGRGFLVNRILMAYMNSAISLVTAGVPIEKIESAALDFGMRMGPIRLYDEVGLDVALQCAWSLSADSETFITRTPTIVRMMKKKQLGCKTGRGFFVHQATADNERVGDINPLAQEIIDAQLESRADLSPSQIEAAIILPMVIEATRLLEIERAHSAWQIDLAVTCGIGFPQSRGGPLWWADQVGASRIVEALHSLDNLGPQLHPTQLLLDVAKDGEMFHARFDNEQPDSDIRASSATRKLS